MSKKIRIVLCGAAGRMGRAVAAAAQNDPRFSILAGIDREPVAGAAFPILPLESLAQSLKQADVLVDFSVPQASLAALDAAALSGCAAVVGTTGFGPGEKARLDSLAARIPLLLSPNMSLGMNLLFHLAGRAAAVLASYDAAVAETHHSLKKDAPSGSALRIIDAVRSARKSDKPVPAASLRVGDVMGDHTLVLAGPGERLELTHRAHSREVFARGALEAAFWIKGRGPGLYSMLDVLGLPPA